MRAHFLIWMMLGLGCSGGVPVSGSAQVRPGIDVLLSDSAHLIAGKRLGLLTNQTGVDRQSRRDIDLLRTTRDARLTVLFSPEHGIRGTEDRENLPDAMDSATGLPIYSLYQGSRTAPRAALDSVDLVLVDLQDIGARYYTYIATTVLLMRDAARAGKRVLVLDRPNPIDGRDAQGNVRAQITDPDSGAAFVGFMPVAMRHGMTIGELARMANDQLHIGADLAVVPAAGWKRSMYFDQTKLPWVKPSPNMPDLVSALNYPGLCLFEGTNVSVGRGTGVAFQVLGAPWLDAEMVISRLMQAPQSRHARGYALAGVQVTRTIFTPRAPSDGKYDGEELWGLRIQVFDRKLYDPTKLTVALLAAIRASHPSQFQIRTERFDILAAGPALRRAIEAGRPAWEIWESWEDELARFRELRSKYLMY